MVGRVAGNPRLRVVCDGNVVLDGDVSYHVRSPDQIYAGWNPIGGTSCGQSLHGSLKREDGQPLRGRGKMESWTMRLLDWWTAEFQRILLFLLLAAAGIFGCEGLFRLGWNGVRAKAAGAARGFRRHICFAAAAAAAALVFSYFVTDGDFDFDFSESFGNFYDFQAVSLLQGRFDVPSQALPSEAFIYHGKNYGYFGPTPALMRIPFVFADLAFGKLSRGFMLLDYLGCLVFAYLILRLAVRMLRGENAVPTRWSIVLLIANAGLGSTLLFLGSRAYIYHEAILCGAVFALAACYFSLCHLARPGGESLDGCVGLRHFVRKRAPDSRTLRLFLSRVRGPGSPAPLPIPARGRISGPTGRPGAGNRRELRHWNALPILRSATSSLEPSSACP